MILILVASLVSLIQADRILQVMSLILSSLRPRYCSATVPETKSIKIGTGRSTPQWWSTSLQSVRDNIMCWGHGSERDTSKLLVPLVLKRSWIPSSIRTISESKPPTSTGTPQSKSRTIMSALSNLYGMFPIDQDDAPTLPTLPTTTNHFSYLQSRISNLLFLIMIPIPHLIDSNPFLFIWSPQKMTDSWDRTQLLDAPRLVISRVKTKTLTFTSKLWMLVNHSSNNMGPKCNWPRMK